MSSLPPERMKWLESYCDQSISPEDFAQLEAALLESEEFRAQARTFLAMDANLHQEAETLLDLGEKWTPQPVVAKKPALLSLRILLPTAALLFLFGLFLGRFTPKSTAQIEKEIAAAVDDGVAVIRETVNSVWSEDGQLQKNSILSPGPYSLTQGSALLECFDGTQLLLSAPVTFDLISTHEVYCRSGKVRAFVPPQARGFKLKAPQFDLIDLGTEFGVEVAANGTSSVQVFDGEVELFSPDKQTDKPLHKLLGGAGLAFSETGETESINLSPEGFLSFQELHKQIDSNSRQKKKSWESWNDSVTKHPELVAHYDFEARSRTLIDQGPGGHHGAIVSANWSPGRFSGKSALEFNSPADRVRLEIPGEFQAMTFSAWVRIDSHTDRNQSILLTDSYKVGYPHWQVSPEGNLRLGVRLPSPDWDTEHAYGTGYGSPRVFNTRKLGVWKFIATTYDSQSGEVVHFSNGEEISRHELLGRQPLKIGKAELGNWGVPFRPDEFRYVVRNLVGRMDTLTLWKTALSPAEIEAIYRQTSP